MRPLSRAFRPAWRARFPAIGTAILAGLLVHSPFSVAAEESPVRDLPPSGEAPAYRGFSLMPKALQRRPHMDFNLLTEMTDEGRKVPRPTTDRPAYYVSQATGAVATGTAPTGNRQVPPMADLEQMMKKALGAASYLPADAPTRPPSLMIVFTYGTHAIDPELPAEVADAGQPPPSTAEEWLAIVVRETRLLADIVERAALVGGPKFAQDLKRALGEEIDNINTNVALSRDSAASPILLPVSPHPHSPFQRFFQSSPLTNYLVETAFHTCYFVVASAYDHEAMRHGQKRLLWRTKMTVDAQGVSMKESLGPLIASAVPYFGRDMPQVAVVSKQISRDGNVEIGEAIVVEADVRESKGGNAGTRKQ